MKIGSCSIPIEIPVGTTMGGYMARSKPSTGTHDDLHAKSIIIGLENKKICLCVADVIGLEKFKTLELKERISKTTGINIENILVSITHTHSGPRNIQIFGDPWEKSQTILDNLYEAAVSANNNLFEGKIEYSRGEIKEVAYNRRDFDENSKKIDFECVALKILDNNNNVKAIVYNFSNHPVVMNPDNLEITADWPYYTEVMLKEKFGKDIDVLFFQGTPGNLNPVNVPMNNPKHTWDDVKEIGDKTGSQLIDILNNSKPLTINNANDIQGAVCNVELDAEDEDKAEIFEWADVIEKEGNFYVSTYCQALKIGNLAIFGIPGEAFSENGMDLKNFANKTNDATMVIGYANDYIGYYGPKAAYLVGGYEMMMMSLSENEGPQIEACALSALKKIDEK